MESKKINLICKERLEKYFSVTEKAFKKVEKKIVVGKEKDAMEIFDMVKNYLSDARYFEKQGHFVNAFAAINYAHGWLDAGVRLGVFNVRDSKLFTVK